MFVHGARHSMVCELLSIKFTTNFIKLVFSLLLFSLCKLVQSTSSKTAFFLELALLPLAELSNSVAILLKLQTRGNKVRHAQQLINVLEL